MLKQFIIGFTICNSIIVIELGWSLIIGGIMGKNVCYGILCCVLGIGTLISIALLVLKKGKNENTPSNS